MSHDIGRNVSMGTSSVAKQIKCGSCQYSDKYIIVMISFAERVAGKGSAIRELEMVNQPTEIKRNVH